MQVCNDLRDLSVHLNEASISYFNPFRPMLGQRAAIDQVSYLKRVSARPCISIMIIDGLYLCSSTCITRSRSVLRTCICLWFRSWNWWNSSTFTLRPSLMEIVCSCINKEINIATFQEGEGDKGCIIFKDLHRYNLHICSSKDYTSSFGSTQYEGSFTPRIHNCFNRYI